MHVYNRKDPRVRKKKGVKKELRLKNNCGEIVRG
jgi:hypothetical protein